jgi:YVTN family beta-propeller protein
MPIRFVALVAGSALPALAWAQASFVNWESPHVSPLCRTPDGARLLAVNTPDNRLEVFDLEAPLPVWLGSVAVGLDPVSARARDAGEVWVVNHLSDSVSVVDLAAMHVVATLPTLDEPADVVFAGEPPRAYVSCSQANVVQVFDPQTHALLETLDIVGEDPRALAVSSDGLTVYAAIFESGNDTTILGGGAVDPNVLTFPPNVVSHPAGPYGGQNPPPNSGRGFVPPLNTKNPPPPAVGLIVRKNAAGQWLDDNGGDWTALVSGVYASLSGRPAGWDLYDHDVAVIDTTTHAVSYIRHLMNLCMQIAVNPTSGAVTVIGTDAINQVRFEPVISGRFLRVNVAVVDPARPQAAAVADLNPHLDYSSSRVAPEIRELSLGDPRAIVWNAAGTVAFVAGMGSNNVIRIGSDGVRLPGSPIAVGAGPTGLQLDEARARLYVLNKFESSISVIGFTLAGFTELARIPLYDPSPAAIKTGRPHLYDTHANSGLGHIACASCHVDGRMDRLAWDLGDPGGEMTEIPEQNCNFGAGFPGIPLPPCEDFHPMKGPMLTQTLQDIIGKEPHHWRGDRRGLEEFAPAFVGLQGDDPLPDEERAAAMQEFEDFLATLHFPPNPFRNLDNTLPAALPLPGHFTTGQFGAAGQPLPGGNPNIGVLRYININLDRAVFKCATCHTLPTGMGSNRFITGPSSSQETPVGEQGELHHVVISVDGSSNPTFKVAQLRNLYERTGFDLTQQFNTAGFGYLHDGSIDSLARFLGEEAFTFTSDQQIADMVAFLLAFAGSGENPQSSPNNINRLPGPASQDTHAGVGWQITFDGSNNGDPAALQLLEQFLALAGEGEIGLVARARVKGETRGYAFTKDGLFQSDRSAQQTLGHDLRLAAAAGGEATFTVVPAGSAVRIGVDQDEDGFLDGDERDACSDPADASRTPDNAGPTGDANRDGRVDLLDYYRIFACFEGTAAGQLEPCRCHAQLDLTSGVDLRDFARFQADFTGS